VDPQVFGSWWTFAGDYSDNSDGRTKELAIEHPFYALDTRWATGFGAKDDERTDSLYDLGKIRDQFGVREKKASAYGGWSRGLQEGWTQRLTWGATYDESQFHSILGETGPTQLVPPDRKLVYPWLGYEWVQDEYEKARNRDQIEKTEDFLLGLHAHVQLGYTATSFGSDRDAWMFDAGISRGFERLVCGHVVRPCQPFVGGARSNIRQQPVTCARSVAAQNDCDGERHPF
jgi:hypothetical protein